MPRVTVPGSGGTAAPKGLAGVTPYCYIRCVIRRAEPELLRREGSGGRVGPETRGVRPGGPGVLHTLALLVWGVFILATSVALAGETGLWWLVLVFGAAVPVALAAQANGVARRRRTGRGEDGEGELLEVLGRHGEVGPALVAMETSLTLAEADGMLDRMAREGYLEVRARDGMLAYALPGRDRRPAEGAPAGFLGGASDSGDAGADLAREASGGASRRPRAADGGALEPLVEPLTERESEVLGLLASGRTNREIASDLFVTVGTVKAHTANIYRKLGARSRAEALARAAELGLRPN